MVETTKFPEKEEYTKNGNIDYYHSQLKEINQLTSENARLHHLTTVLIDHIWKTGDRGLPLKEIDKKMALFDDGGMDGTPRNS
tara:strand:+ start:120 stop:368 length:249 start_codon:yes stop_codon:yes gene_type:complete